MVTASEVSEYQRLLIEVNRLAIADLIALWRKFEHLLPDEFFAALRDGVSEIVALYRATAADTAMLFYMESQGLALSDTDALAASQVNEDALARSVGYALFHDGVSDPLAMVAGMMQRHVVNGARDYGLSVLGKDGGGWYRHARPNACEFCRMLATRATARGGAYSSADAAVTVGAGKRGARGKRLAGSSFHDHCMCIPVKASEYVLPEYVEMWDEQYMKARDLADSSDPRQILKAMRQLNV